MKHASIIPLIGGEAIGAEAAFGSPPDFLVSYGAFASNDSHLRNYYEQRGLSIPYYVLDGPDKPSVPKADVVSSVCPCAGLSALSITSSADNATNDWMYTAAEYAMGEMGAKVYWGENAPALFTDKGKKVRERLIEIGKSHGYTASFYRTQSLKHGVPQVRNRSFFFFWKGERAPVFSYFDTPYQRIEDLIRSVRSNTLMDPINPKTPSQDPLYAYLLEVVAGGKTHREYVQEYSRNLPEGLPARGNDVVNVIEKVGCDLKEVESWLRSRGSEKEAEYIKRIYTKREVGLGTMNRNTIIPVNYIGAFVGHYPYKLTHPVEDRYITYREALSIMGMPENFELLDPKRNINHICQNVPVQTARDMASEVLSCLESPASREWVNGTVMQNNVNGTHEVLRDDASTLSKFFDR